MTTLTELLNTRKGAPMLDATQADAEKLGDLTEAELFQVLRDREEFRQQAEMAAEVAATRRNAVILEMASRNVTNANIARATGISPTRVAQLIARGLTVPQA